MSSDFSPFDKTLMMSSEHQTAGNEKPSRARHPLVALVQGSSPRLSGELNDLLRDRLRIASLLLFFGYLSFFIKNLFFLDRFQTTLDWVVLGSHFAMTVITGLIGLRMCMGCRHLLSHLRMVEHVVFGGSNVVFALLSYTLLVNTAPLGYLVSVAPAWLLLIFTYALYVPNTFERAAITIGGMALTGILTVVLAWGFSEDVARVMAEVPIFQSLLLETGMLLSFAAVIGVWGVKTIGTLRRQAYEAKQLGQYKLKQLLGKGGMGEVHLAEHVLMKRPCALKLIHPDKAGNPQNLARFEREVQATAALSHWNTIEIFDYGHTDDGTFYYVMEYLPGSNLQQLVEMFGPLPPERIIHLLMQVCDALSEAHAKGLVHRDIKPANVFAANRGGVYDVVKLLDFGLVKPLSDFTSATLTQDGTISGSPLFMSPEQATAEAVEPRSDLYSLGAVGYFLLTGRPPFEGEKPIKILMAHVGEPPVPPSRIQLDVPVDLERVILRCLSKSPQDRFESAKALRSAFSECQSAGHWTRDCAAQWWQRYGCHQKKQLDARVLEACAG